jgi:hypothetical protein
MPESPYFAERHGRAPRVGPLDYETVRRLVASVWDSLRGQGYFHQAFGYDCVDGDTFGEVGPDPNAYFLRCLGRGSVWP